MEKTARLEAYFEQDGPFSEGLAILRQLLHETELQEHLKWKAPVYALEGTNVLGLMAFKKHFSLWFFNGAFLSDPLSVLTNSQEGKTQAMRHWKFSTAGEIDPRQVKAYVQEAIGLARKGVKLVPAPRPKLEMPETLQTALGAEAGLLEKYNALAPYKRRDYAEYIATAKQAATIEKRLEKIIPMIRQGLGLNDKYRKG